MVDPVSLQARATLAIEGGDRAAQFEIRNSILAEGVNELERTEVRSLLRDASARATKVFTKTAADRARVASDRAAGKTGEADRLLTDIKAREENAVAMHKFAEWLFNEVEAERSVTPMDTEFWIALWGISVDAAMTILPASTASIDALVRTQTVFSDGLVADGHALKKMVTD
ncbi:MAG: hypothetical protein V3T05_12885 [Myxococcota bacterium]